MILQEKHILKLLTKPKRLSDLEAGTFSTIQSRKAFKKALKNDLVRLNGSTAQTANYVQGGELIEIYINKTKTNKSNITIDLDIIFEDEFLAVINKPAGIEVSGNKRYTITNALTNTLKCSNKDDALANPLPAHRLDYPTNGCLLIGKTTKALTALNKLFEQQQIKKTYLAITIHPQEQKGKIEAPIDGKASISTYQTLTTIPSTKYGALNLVALNPKTGRRHQLRKHLVSIGNPIFGEKLYGKPEQQGSGNGLYLQAYKLEFTHPITTEKLVITSPVIKKFKKIFDTVENKASEAIL